MAAIKPFPLQGPVRPEGRQIGRGPAIDGLARQVLTSEQHTLLLANRRIGKTSMALAVLDRLRDSNSGWAIEADLSRGPVLSAAQLAERLSEQARAARVHVQPASLGILLGARRALKLGATPALNTAARLLGLDELADVSELAASIDQSLAPVDDGPLDLRTVLRAIQAAAIAADRPAVVFLDEVQRLTTDWAEANDSLYAQEALAEVMEQPDGRVVLLLAGSERHAIEALLAEGQPLHHDGMPFDVPPIGDDDWHHHLPLRFAEAGLEVGRDHVAQILAASEGHPQRTMRVCAHVAQLADGELLEVSDVVIGVAVENARRHPSWSD